MRVRLETALILCRSDTALLFVKTEQQDNDFDVYINMELWQGSQYLTRHQR